VAAERADAVQTCGFSIERASPVHAPAMAALWHAHLAQTRDEVDASFTPALTLEQTAQRWAQAIGSGELLAWVARTRTQSEAQIAGYLTAKVLRTDPLFGDTFARKPVLYLVDVDVDAAFRGHRLSRKLVAAAEDYARAHRIDALELAAIARDAQAIEVWRKAGFEARCVVMRRAVDGPD
jgi:ribosomal protein S18 acetylase RimI-like enzyme